MREQNLQSHNIDSIGSKKQSFIKCMLKFAYKLMPFCLGFGVIGQILNYLYFSYYLEGYNGTDATILAVIGGICVTIFEITLIKAHKTNPGYILKNNQGFGSQQNRENIDFEDQTQRFCDLCQVYKEISTHHCSRCKRCVDEMDHHCGIIGNCVGINNRKLFMLVLLWGSISLVIACIFSCIHLPVILPQTYAEIFDQNKNSEINSWVKARHWYICCFELMSFSSFFGLFWFFLSNLHIISKNSTTIHEILPQLKNNNDNIQQLSFQERIQNIKRIFGPNWVTWIVPTKYNYKEDPNYIQNIGQTIQLERMDEQQLN